MSTIKAYTTIEQSRKLAGILPLESADMEYLTIKETGKLIANVPFVKDDSEVEDSAYSCTYDKIACWSLAALMKILHRNEKDIVSLSYGGYKDGEYILNWCLDYEFEDGDYTKTFSDNPVDACVAMIEKLNESNLL